MRHIPFAPLILAALIANAGLGEEPAPVRVVAPLPYGAVRLLDGPFKAAQDLDRKVLLGMSADRYLAWFRREADLAPKAEPYGGWEREGVAGQTGGHYLSALCLMWKATGDREIGTRIDYMVDELVACQQANGDGYLAAIPDGKAIFADLKAGKPLRGWVPWYTLHKILAGLRDAWTIAGNARARAAFIALGDWVCDEIAGIDDARMQRMLDVEHGGMPEVLADLTAVTGDAKYLTAAERFCHQALLAPLAAGTDALTGRHANTQIPKIIGFSRIAELGGGGSYEAASRFFWQTVVGTRTWVIGGNSDHEHFFPPERAVDHVESAATAETCNTYNMLRLTRLLYSHQPRPEQLDYIERALYNQILAGQEPVKGMFTYFQSLRSGHFHIYSSPIDSGWCCLGTGMENPGRYTESACWTDAAGITIGLYLPAEITWAERGVVLRQTTKLPAEEDVAIAVTKAPVAPFAIRLRAPGWLAGPLEVRVNGTATAADVHDGLVTITRSWRAGDALTVHLPMAIRTEPVPFDTSRVAILYGPVVLAGDLGTAGLEKIGFWQGGHDEKKYADLPVPPVPVLVAADHAALVAGVVRVPGPALAFRTVGLGHPAEATLRPYSELHFERYAVYWRLFTPAAWTAEEQRVATEERVRRELDARTLAVVRPGEQQDEVNFALQSEDSKDGIGAGGRRWRDAGQWFSYTVPLGEEPSGNLVLRCTWWGGDQRRFAIRVDGREVAVVALDGSAPGRFVEADYPLPSDLTQGKQALTIRFQAVAGRAGGLFGLCLLRER